MTLSQLQVDPGGMLTMEDASFYLDSTSSRYREKFRETIRAMLALLTSQDVDYVINDVYKIEKQLAEVRCCSVIVLRTILSAAGL